MQRSKIVGRVCLFLLLLSISACAGWLSFSAPAQPGLRSPGSLGQSLNMYSRVHYSDVSSSENFELILAVNTQRIKLVIMGEFGQRLATINYDGIALQVQEELGSRPYKLSYRQLLLDFQLIFWPDTAWLKSGEQADWRIETTALQRRVFYKNVLYTVIDQQVDADQYWYYNAHLNHNLLVKAAQL